MRIDQIALQLYTVRRPAAADLGGTLQAVADAGYRSVELAGLPEIPPTELAGLLRAASLRVVASHEPLDRLRTDPEGVADRLVALDCPRAVVPSFGEGDRRTPTDVSRLAAELGGYARLLGERGLRLAYHNHAFEFEPLDGTSVWEILLAELPQEVEIELDVYWATFGGRDPVVEIRSLAGRVRLLHMKDMAPGPERRDAPPGAGLLPFPEIVEAARDAGVEWYIVEQDEPASPVEDAARGLQYLERLAAGGSGGRTV